ncbi:RNA binding protein rnp24 [Colletotrichum musicola]|uniref:RNA binding protein rnp24 n=1 Tax=Colletotrichum musicola TaxID=2175873 RepID=A0A8H6NSP4_9PEZI|nr:RNA binding protein rnp24 [Colletotrichum musicola]
MAASETKKKSKSKSKEGKVKEPKEKKEVKEVKEVKETKDVAKAPEEAPAADAVEETTKTTTADADADATNTPSPSSKKRKPNVEDIEIDVDAPEPPSKRAKRALKKGKKLPPKHDSDEEKEAKKKKKKEEEGKDGAAKRSEHGVWVGNLPFFVTAEELRNWLVANSGEMITEASITRLHMPTTKEPGRDKPFNKGFAYVDFDDVAPKVAAIALTEAELGHRKLLIKDSKSYEGRPKKEAETAAGDKAEAGGKGAAAKDEVPKSSKIFVGNMSFQTTEEDVRQHFDKCGQIDWVKVATFEDSGKCKGYGWVKFREPESAGWAVKGFVKIKEEIETEDDFVDDKKENVEGDEEMKDAGDEDKDEDEEAAEEKKTKKDGKSKADAEQKFKTRKWWVNKLFGRPLKIELAEDDQTRYKKRFGKDAPKRRQEQQQQQEGGEDGEGEKKEKKEWKPRAPKPASSELKAQDDIMVARLTGAAAKHTGTKITFD